MLPASVEDEPQMEIPGAAVRAGQLGNPIRFAVGVLESVQPLLV
jgi:hypothetical protein